MVAFSGNMAYRLGGVVAAMALLGAGCRRGVGPGHEPGGVHPPGDACRTAGASCSAAAQCCSNRCEFPRGAQAGACTSSAELDGPLAALPAAQKRADFRLDPPAVLDASAIAGLDGQSIVKLRFRDDARLGATLALRTDDGPLVLH